MPESLDTKWNNFLGGDLLGEIEAAGFIDFWVWRTVVEGPASWQSSTLLHTMASSIIDMPEALSPSHSAVPQTCGASCPLSSLDSPGTSSQPEPSVITPVSHLDSLVHLGKCTAIYHIPVSCPSVPTLSIAITDQILASLHFPLISLHCFSFPVLVFLVLF